jgi:hypothetical protein
MAIPALLCMLLVAACARPPVSTYDPTLADRLVPAKSTLDDARKLLGPPSRIRTFASGHVLARWSYAGAGVASSLDITFDNDERMIAIVRRR